MSDKITELHTKKEPDAPAEKTPAVSADNTAQVRAKKEPGRRGKAGRIVILAVLIVAVLGAITLFLFADELNLDGAFRWFKYCSAQDEEGFGSYSFDSHSSNNYAAFDDGLAVASISGLTLYDEYGRERSVVQQQIDMPKLLTNDEIALIFDVGGYDLVALHEEDGEVLRLETTHPILDADMSAEGAICVSTSGSGYKSVLEVYNDGQDKIYRWSSSGTYYPLCAITQDGARMAAVAVGQSEGEFESRVCVFRTNAEQIERQISLGNELIYDLVFVTSDVLCAIGEKSVQYLTLSGELLGSYPYDERYLKQFDCGGDGFLTLTMNMYRAGNRYSLITVDDESANVIADTYIGEEILDVSASDRYVAVLTPGKLTIYTKDHSVYSQSTEIGDATSVVMRSDGSVLLLGGGRGELYIP